MNEIPLIAKKEKEALPICRRAREGLISTYHLIEMIALQYFEAKRDFGRDGKKPEIDGLKHLLNCPKCKIWFHDIIPPAILKRQKRITEYCCVGLFCAMEEYKDRSVPKMEFTMFRGEDPCWVIESKYSFISYCPWCGKKLPDKPY
ncbi:MAG: hypothetical protein GY705_02495 [Bacteroidetes bacterium]|nr:hypothetical protein [Bacteroidota bacterium]